MDSPTRAAAELRLKQAATIYRKEFAALQIFFATAVARIILEQMSASPNSRSVPKTLENLAVDTFDRIIVVLGLPGRELPTLQVVARVWMLRETALYFESLVKRGFSYSYLLEMGMRDDAHLKKIFSKLLPPDRHSKIFAPAARRDAILLDLLKILNTLPQEEAENALRTVAEQYTEESVTPRSKLLLQLFKGRGLSEAKRNQMFDKLLDFAIDSIEAGDDGWLVSRRWYMELRSKESFKEKEVRGLKDVRRRQISKNKRRTKKEIPE